MTKYDIYAGMPPYVKNEYRGTLEFESPAEADAYAYDLAYEFYALFEGDGVLRSWDDIRLELLEDCDFEEPNDDEISKRYEEDIERWIEYWAEEVDS